MCVWYNPIHVQDDSILIPSHYNEEGSQHDGEFQSLCQAWQPAIL